MATRVEEAFTERVNKDTWKVKAILKREDGGEADDDGEEESSSFAFDTGGGTMHRNQSLKTVSKVPNDAPDFNGAIEVDNEGNHAHCPFSWEML